MAYTVQEAANLSGTTVKTLYHNQKVGLLLPSTVGENGYRYYTHQELERLQQIMFYCALDFSLEQIKIALENEPNRLTCLEQQKVLLSARKERLSVVLNTLEETISYARKGVPMKTEKMFAGLNKEEWGEALKDQNEYGYSINAEAVDAAVMNENAEEAAQFMAFMAKSLKDGLSAQEETVLSLLNPSSAW
ncbi:MerR family transcriptional regulator [Hungatella hathewayi]|uniref:MerR family transcriptional regulator n=1 Tax=Hungatella hathewayi TaxID=154046 RepID=UPI003565DEB6